MSEEIKDLKQELNELDEEYVKLYEKYCNLRNEKKDLQQKVEQLENIRKEAIEFCKKYDFILKWQMLDILNKGSEQ